MPPYRVFIAAEVIANLQTIRGTEKRLIARLLENLAGDPFRMGDFEEHDDTGIMGSVPQNSMLLH